MQHVQYAGTKDINQNGTPRLVMNPVKELKQSLFVLLLLVSLGIAGFMVIEQWRFLDALYMTVITLGTVGFQEVHCLSDAGKVFTILLIVFGVSVLGYTVGKLAQIMFEGQFQRFLGSMVSCSSAAT